MTIRTIDMGWRSARKEIVEQPKRVVPFQWHIFVGEPAFMRRRGRIDQKGGKEGV